MGSTGSITLNHYSKRDLQVPHEVLSLMPSYYTSKITKKDLFLCKKNWEVIGVDLIPMNGNKAYIGLYFDSCRTWLYSTLFEGLIEEVLLETRLVNHVHLFLNDLLDIIVLSFNQWNHYQDFQQKVQVITKRCCNYGIKSTHFINFGPVLFNSLTIVSVSFSSEHERAWKNLYSSILAVIIPYCLSFQDVLTFPAAEGVVEEPTPQPVRTDESKPLPTDVNNRLPHERVITLSSTSRLRMQTSLSNSVPL